MNDCTNCEHPWAKHNDHGCCVEHGHDDYCMCMKIPPALADAQREKRRQQSLCYPCPAHRRYRALRAPRVACERCWRMWITVNP